MVSVQECLMMHIMRPAGKNGSFIDKKYFKTKSAYDLFLIRPCIYFRKDIPESRQAAADELTDEFLLAALGDYDGIVNS